MRGEQKTRRPEKELPPTREWPGQAAVRRQLATLGLNREVAELQLGFGGNPGAADARVDFFQGLRARR